MTHSILIADDDPDIVELLTTRCESWGLSVDSANNAMTALGKAEELLPDVVLLDVDMPYGNGLSVCEMMAGHRELASTPVIVMTGDGRQETQRRCHQMCAYYVPKSTELWPRIEGVLRELLGAPADSPAGSSAGGDVLPPIAVDAGGAAPSLIDAAFAMLSDSPPADGMPQEGPIAESRPWILSIEDDDDVAHALQLRFKEIGCEVVRAAAGRDGYRRAFFDSPRLILLDYELPEGNGDYVLRRLKESPATRDIPVIVLTGRREPAIENQMRRLGADEFLHKPFDWERLRDVASRFTNAACC